MASNVFGAAAVVANRPRMRATLRRVFGLIRSR
jgi:hypothetical protein